MQEINKEQKFECLCGHRFISTEWYYPYRHNKKIIAEICPECTSTVEKRL